MMKGDLVMWKATRDTGPPDYGVVIDVRAHLGIIPEEVLVKFPLDGSEGWYLSKNLVKMERSSESC